MTSLLDNLPPVHPGEILAEELACVGLSVERFARAIEVPDQCIAEILACKRAVTSDVAVRMGKYFGTSAQFWVNLQSAYDRKIARNS